VLYVDEFIFYEYFRMMNIQYREATVTDILGIAIIRADEWGGVDYWTDRITGYIDFTHHPQQALAVRIIYVAVADAQVIGFIAGHLTQRHNCKGELQWINVVDEYRGTGVASALLKLLAQWFIDQNAVKVCVNADAENPTAHRFYRRYGAIPLNPHWLVWKDISIALK
jgi:GNAT superfamily N-acetyltransferase